VLGFLKLIVKTISNGSPTNKRISKQKPLARNLTLPSRAKTKHVCYYDRCKMLNPTSVSRKEFQIGI
jgi:hypothetical protein